MRAIEWAYFCQLSNLICMHFSQPVFMRTRDMSVYHGDASRYCRDWFFLKPRGSLWACASDNQHTK